MKTKKSKHKKIPLQLLAVRKANRDAEKELLGAGFHVRTKVVKNKKRYTRKQKHKGAGK